MSSGKSGIQVQEIDKNMRLDETINTDIKWLSPMEAPFRLSGFAWMEKDRIYRRLPLYSPYGIPGAVDTLSNCTAGGQIHFRTDTVKLSIRVRLSGAANMNHMPATGQCGFDCYLGEPGHLYFCKTTRYDHKESQYEFTFFEVKERKLRTVVLNFPLYQGVEQVMVGVDKQAEVMEPLPYRSDKCVIFYGTSITQGGCASRPGMAYTNIISRRLNMKCINLGFSGSGKGEPEMARIITEIEKPGCIVLDYEANSIDPEHFHKTLPEFVKILRSAHRGVPILVVSQIRFANELIDEDSFKKSLANKDFQLKMVEELNLKGDKFIYFYDGSELLGDSFDECTVDGVHPTDLGFLRIADKLTPVLEKILS